MPAVLTEEHAEKTTELDERVGRPAERPRRREYRYEPPAEYLAAGSVVETFGGAGVVVLSIIGLAHLFPTYLLPISIIGIGATLFFMGGTLMVRYTKALVDYGRHIGDVAGGITSEFLAGITGITLGVLSLLGVAPLVLAPVAVIVFGCAVLLSGTATYRLHRFMITEREPKTAYDWIVREVVLAGVATELLVGLAVGVLGILALVGFNPWVLCLAATLSLGGSILLGSAALSNKVWRLFGC
jgi:hypothetical protein